jgi:hypothetical protein
LFTLYHQFGSVFTTTTTETQNALSIFPPALVKEFLTYIHETPAKKVMSSDAIPVIVVKTVP